MRRLAFATATAAAALAATGVGAKLSDNACPSAAAFRPGALGAVAYWRSFALHVVDVTSGADRVVLRTARRAIAGLPLTWSSDGRRIAAGDTVVPAAGGRPCLPLGRRVAELQWLRHGEVAGTTAKGALVVGEPGKAPRLVAPPPGRGVVFGGIFDPAGGRVAVGGARRSLWVVSLANRRRSLLYRSPSDAVGLPVPRAWTSDGRWVLFANDEYGSNSIAADGLPLLAVPSSGGRAIQLERHVLLGDDFVQRCGGDRLVVSAGFDRYVSAHKRVDLVSPPSWRPRNLSRDTSRSWYSAACSPDGKWVAATVTRNRDEGRFDTAERSIWLLSSDGSRRRVLVGKPGDGISAEAPRWSRDGRWILYVSHRAHPQPNGRLYLVDVATGKRRGPIAQIDGGLGYYGYHDWTGAAAWYQQR